MNDFKDLPSQSYIKSRIDYNPKTGELTWKYCPNMPAWWNRRWAGRKALAKVSARGYLVGCIDNTHYLAHRVIYKLMTGLDPECIDHINHNRTDNRWENLRNTTYLGNGRNQSISKNNSSGINGVYFDRIKRKWSAQITLEGKTHQIGRFKSKTEASSARKRAEREYGFLDPLEVK